MCALLALALAGCGGTSVADCLNGQGFLVVEHADVVRGSSAHGVNFTLTLYRGRSDAALAYRAEDHADAALLGRAVVDFAGNPAASRGRAPGKLSREALATIERCVGDP